MAPGGEARVPEEGERHPRTPGLRRSSERDRPGRCCPGGSGTRVRKGNFSPPQAVLFPRAAATQQIGSITNKELEFTPRYEQCC